MSLTSEPLNVLSNNIIYSLNGKYQINCEMNLPSTNLTKSNFLLLSVSDDLKELYNYIINRDKYTLTNEKFQKVREKHNLRTALLMTFST